MTLGSVSHPMGCFVQAQAQNGPGSPGSSSSDTCFALAKYSPTSSADATRRIPNQERSRGHSAASPEDSPRMARPDCGATSAQPRRILTFNSQHAVQFELTAKVASLQQELHHVKHELSLANWDKRKVDTLPLSGPGPSSSTQWIVRTLMLCEWLCITTLLGAFQEFRGM
jgi:hypothetical protein